MINSSDGSYPLYLFSQGRNCRAYQHLGAHRDEDGSVLFCTWAPGAASVSVVGDFNGWDRDADPMERFQNSGI